MDPSDSLKHQPSSDASTNTQKSSDVFPNTGQSPKLLTRTYSPNFGNPHLEQDTNTIQDLPNPLSDPNYKSLTAKLTTKASTTSRGLAAYQAPSAFSHLCVSNTILFIIDVFVIVYSGFMAMRLKNQFVDRCQDKISIEDSDKFMLKTEVSIAILVKSLVIAYKWSAFCIHNSYSDLIRKYRYQMISSLTCSAAVFPISILDMEPSGDCSSNFGWSDYTLLNFDNAIDIAKVVLGMYFAIMLVLLFGFIHANYIASTQPQMKRVRQIVDLIVKVLAYTLTILIYALLFISLLFKHDYNVTMFELISTLFYLVLYLGVKRKFIPLGFVYKSRTKKSKRPKAKSDASVIGMEEDINRSEDLSSSRG